MRHVLAGLVLALLWITAAAAQCIILNEEKVQVGNYKGVKGLCSNNRLPVTCVLMEGIGVECDGPSGGYTGKDLDSLIFSACGCSSQKEKELELKKQLEPR